MTSTACKKNYICFLYYKFGFLESFILIGQITTLRYYLKCDDIGALLRGVSMSQPASISTTPGEHFPINWKGQVVLPIRMSCKLHYFPRWQCMDKHRGLTGKHRFIDLVQKSKVEKSGNSNMQCHINLWHTRGKTQKQSIQMRDKTRDSLEWYFYNFVCRLHQWWWEWRNPSLSRQSVWRPGSTVPCTVLVHSH